MPSPLFMVAVFLAVAAASASQQRPAIPASAAGSLSLDGILMRLQIRRWEYARNVPDFFADETVASEMRGLHTPAVRALTESIFRLRRDSPPGVYPPDLAEVRSVRSSSGMQIIKGSPLSGPVVLINAFSSGLSIITLSQKACYDFTLSPHRDLHHIAVFAIGYRMKPGAETTGYCMPWQGVSGQAIVDASTFNILHFDMHVPRYQVTPKLEGPWRWSIDYGPVIFDGATFSMPRHIESVSEAIDGSLMWTFVASYHNYHKTDVHSRIITNVEDTQNLH